MADNEPINLDVHRSRQSLASMIERLEVSIAQNYWMRREYPELAPGCEDRIVAAETLIGRLSSALAALQMERGTRKSG